MPRFPQTEYFRHTRRRPDRSGIKEEWIEHVIDHPEQEVIPWDGRIRRWALGRTGSGVFFGRSVNQVDRCGPKKTRVPFRSRSQFQPRGLVRTELDRVGFNGGG